MAAIPKHCEVVIERGYLVYPESLDHSEAREVDHGKVLVGKVFAYPPCNLEVGCRNMLDHAHPLSHSLPKPISDSAIDASLKEKPRLDQDVVRGHQLIVDR
jgi:hypothetical protein